MTAINYVRNLAGGGVGAARFGRPRYSLRSARWLVVQPGPTAHAHRGQALRSLRCPPCWLRWGFALHEALWRRVVGVSEPHVVQFPPFGGGDVAV